MFRDVRNSGMAGRLAEGSEMKTASAVRLSVLGIVVAFFAATFVAPPLRAEGVTLPPEALKAMDEIYGGDPDAAIVIAREMEKAQPDHPLGYLLDAEAIWWKRYCAACEIKFGMVDAWKRSKESDDAEYLTLTDSVIRVAQARLAQSETAEMHTYAGLGWEIGRAS